MTLRGKAMGESSVQQGQLYIVATPIGNLADITERAIDVLKKVDAIAVEDTRHSRKLLQHFSINTPMFALHDFNESQKVDEIIMRIMKGEKIALISDAGTPLISDPGYQLVKLAHQHELRVTPIPGASAVIAALSCAGLPSNRFTFEGFLPSKAVARMSTLQKVMLEQRTMIFYEAPHRIVACLYDMEKVFGGERFVVLARELTKTFETVRGGALAKLLPWIEQDQNQQKGEFVVLVHGAEKQVDTLDSNAMHVLQTLRVELPLKQAAALAAKITGIKKNILYRAGLEEK
ncbi:16S rRNA (cytidine(1402)-2'-O)-methyltransferase [Gammaproteobacteria bacterium]|nr:16S rRNA (cytidine(1402)-2'-O)-methyltransferase [Gammaproteobacteria bacterium]